MNRTLTAFTLLLAGVAATPVHAQSVLDRSGPGVSSDGWARSDVRRYYPEDRHPPVHYERPILGWFDVRGGFYDEQNVSANDWTVGIKGVGRVVPGVLAGISTDLHRRTDSGRTVTSSYIDATGHTVVTSTQLFDAESNLWPIMGVLEFHVPTSSLDPYIGGGLGWEFLDTHAYDARTGYYSDANYDGFGYQVYGGLGVPINKRARLTLEAFWNGSTVQREVYDYYSGFVLKEKIEVDGGGGRAGLGFAF